MIKICVGFNANLSRVDYRQNPPLQAASGETSTLVGNNKLNNIDFHYARGRVNG